jgi:hypothetical protein
VEHTGNRILGPARRWILFFSMADDGANMEDVICRICHIPIGLYQ